MKLFRSQENYDIFNERLSNILDTKYIPHSLVEDENTFTPDTSIIPWNKGIKGQQKAWNKGLTKDTDNRIRSKPVSEDKKKRISEKLKGHTVSAETRIKMSDAKKGKEAWNKGKKINNKNMRRVRVTNGIQIFDSVKEAAESENVSPSAIIRRIKSNKNWSYVKFN